MNPSSFTVGSLLSHLKEKTHLLWWALRMCSVAVRLAPPIIQSCSTNLSLMSKILLDLDLFCFNNWIKL